MSGVYIDSFGPEAFMTVITQATTVNQAKKFTITW